VSAARPLAVVRAKAHELLDLMADARVFHAVVDKVFDLAESGSVGRADSPALRSAGPRKASLAREITRPPGESDAVTAERARRALRQHGFVPTVKP
jgi:hypothetical protein